MVPRLQRLYGDISDIDLFLGGLMERPADDALLGPTFQCLVGDQFKRLKFGDRFWFEEGRQSNSFTEGTLSFRAGTDAPRPLQREALSRMGGWTDGL